MYLLIFFQTNADYEYKKEEKKFILEVMHSEYCILMELIGKDIMKHTTLYAEIRGNIARITNFEKILFALDIDCQELYEELNLE